MSDISGYCLCQSVAVSYLVLVPVVDLAEALHSGVISLQYVSQVNGYDHIVEGVHVS